MVKCSSGCHDTAALKLFNINIASIQAEEAECKTNTGDMRGKHRTGYAHSGERICKHGCRF